MKKSIPIQEYILPVSIEEDETGGFIATCPVWDDCYAQADTVEDVAKEIQQVASSLIKEYQDEDIQVPLS
jgi:predicted RNase H-like HicB family nuclease